MKLNLYSIFDKAVESFNAPFYMHTDKEAIRAFNAECMNPESKIAQHPVDFELHMLGTFDNQTSVIDQTGARRLVFALECKQVYKPFPAKDVQPMEMVQSSEEYAK